VGRAELTRHFLANDVAVQPSLTESFGKAWIDAMIHGLPVLTCYIGAAEAAIGGQGTRGWLVPAGDSEALAGRMREVLTAPIDWPALRRRCREYAESLTLENWQRRIGEICAKSWNCTFSEGKLKQ
jgi:glycosyltransferase involved in cell wall biosynthesis